MRKEQDFELSVGMATPQTAGLKSPKHSGWIFPSPQFHVRSYSIWAFLVQDVRRLVTSHVKHF